ncbi:MAG: Trk system potassium transporter TrkA [Candidatus Rifleibacteriota bacterium]
MKIVISGGGEIGYLFAQQFSVGNDVHVIETDEELIARLEKLDLQVIRGNPTSLLVLQAASVPDADAFIACAHSDEVNVISCLAAKQLGNTKTFCFVNKSHYFETFAGELGEHLVIDALIWPEKILAEYICKIISVPGAIDVKVFEHENLKLYEYRFKEGDTYIGKTLKDLNLPKGTLAVAVFRGENIIIPGGATEFMARDKIIFMGLADNMSKLEARFNYGIGNRQNVIVIGGGTVGGILASSLAATGKAKIRLIEHSFERCQILSEELPDEVLILNADGTVPSYLKSLQIENCDCVVVLTGSDERNLLVSMQAKQLGAKRVITRAHSVENLDFFENVGIDVALSSQFNAIQNVTKKISDESIDVFTIFEKGKAEIREIHVPSNFPPSRLIDLKLPAGVIIAAIRRGGHTIVPHGEDKIKGKDRLRVFCAVDQGESIHDFLHSFSQKASHSEDRQ